MEPVTTKEVGKHSIEKYAVVTGLSLGGVCDSADIGSVYGRFSDLQATYSLQLPSPQEE
jgi:hypothetical protein